MLKSVRGERHELRKSRQIPVRVCDLAVPQVRGKVEHACVYVDAVLVPIEEPVAGECMTKVVDSRSPFFGMLPSESDSKSTKRGTQLRIAQVHAPVHKEERYALYAG
jgi:hypothetical protein